MTHVFIVAIHTLFPERNKCSKISVSFERMVTTFPAVTSDKDSELTFRDFRYSSEQTAALAFSERAAKIKSKLALTKKFVKLIPTTKQA